MQRRQRSAVYFISIHALREEGDATCPCASATGATFLSTPSVRRATAPLAVEVTESDISIHALREEGDNYIKADFGNVSNFYPRPP